MADRLGQLGDSEVMTTDEALRRKELESLRLRSVLMHAIGFIEGVADGIQLSGPITHDKLADRMRETAIELREQL
jgi:hypothetical protein